MRSNFAYDTEALWQQDRDHIIHPWIDLGSAKTREPLIVAAAEGVHIYDSRGHRMIDGIGGMWCVNIGYGREEMAQAIADQVRRMPYFSPFGLISTPPSIWSFSSCLPWVRKDAASGSAMAPLVSASNCAGAPTGLPSTRRRRVPGFLGWARALS